MIAKRVCNEPGCGTTFQVQGGDDAPEQAQALLEQHIKKEHSSLLRRGANFLCRLRDRMAAASVGTPLTTEEAHAIHVEVCELISHDAASSLKDAEDEKTVIEQETQKLAEEKAARKLAAKMPNTKAISLADRVASYKAARKEATASK